MLEGTLQSFNLVHEPFIPCLTQKGEAVEYGLRQTLIRAHELQEIRDESPLVTIALHRLLIALCHAALGDPETFDDWEGIWRAERFDESKIDRYFDQWGDRFDLFDPDRPFYQAWNWELPDDKRKGANELAQEQTRGNNATLFDHTIDAPKPKFSFAEAARSVIANQTFAAAGGISATGNRTGAPLVGQAVVMPIGQFLRETLVLNLLTSEDRPEVLQPVGIPVWEREQPSFSDSPIPDGYLDLLTWQPRRIRLHATDGAAEVGEISYAQGRKLALPDGCFDPVTAYRNERPLEFDADRSVWRDSEALFSKNRDATKRPLVLSFLADLVENEHLSETQELSFVCAGLKNRQAKVFFWRHDILPLPVHYLTEDDLVSRLTEALSAAETIAVRLDQAIKSAATELLDPTNHNPDPKRRRQFVDFLATNRLYWSRLETPFRRFFIELAGIPADKPDTRQKRLAAWVIEDCRRAALHAFDQSVGRLDRSARTLRAMQAGRDSLSRLIGAFLNQNNYWKAYHGENEDAT